MGNFQQLEVEGRWEKSETIADRTFVAFFFFWRVSNFRKGLVYSNNGQYNLVTMLKEQVCQI